jgi:hypothetical protein
VSNVIQLGFDERYDKLFWVDPHLWDERDSPPDSIQRPTEIAAFRNLARQAAALRKRGLYINLTPLHIQAMQLEYHCKTDTVDWTGMDYEWISKRMRGVPPLQVKALLGEASLAVLFREILGMPALYIDWNADIAAIRRAA